MNDLLDTLVSINHANVRNLMGRFVETRGLEYGQMIENQCQDKDCLGLESLLHVNVNTVNLVSY